MKDGKATGEYEDFLVGFVTQEGNVWGRPVGVAVAKDGVADGHRRRLGDGLAGGVHGEEVSLCNLRGHGRVSPQMTQMNVRLKNFNNILICVHLRHLR